MEVQSPFEGRLIRLRALEPDDEPLLYQFYNDFEVTQHLVGNREVHLDGDRATSRSMFINPNRMRIDGEVRHFVCGGYYHDRLERRPEGWRIVRRIEDTLWWQDPMPGLPDVPPGLAPNVTLDAADNW